jgi:DNA-binding CsgD family transcriptional regulator
VPPLLLVDDDAACAAALEALRREGWHPHAGWSLPGGGWDHDRRRIVCHGGVQTPLQARAAVHAAARGAGIVAVVVPDAQVTVALYADLRRLGPVELRLGGPPPPLDADQLRMLDLIARGATLDGVAAELSYSLRTVNRRLARARAALGAATTAEAVAALRDYSSRS